MRKRAEYITVLVDLRQDLLDLQRSMTEHVLRDAPDDSAAALQRFLEEHAAGIAHIRQLQQRAAADTTPSALMVIASRLRALRAAGRDAPDS